MTANEIAKRLAARAEQAAAHLLPSGSRHGREWLAGSTAGEAGGSLHVILEGERAGVWRDFAGSEEDKGDLIGLWQRARNVSLYQACQEALDWLDVPHHERNANRQQPTVRKRSHEPDKRWLEIQAIMRRPSADDLTQIAALRKLPSTAGLTLAVEVGHLFIAPVHDAGELHPAFIITDNTRRNAQARKLDGALWQFGGNRKPAKAKTIWGTDNSWPIGAADCTEETILFAEGGPDLLAAHHLIATTGERACPVCMFGDSNAIAEDALPFFRGTTVIFFPHQDDNGAGQKAAARWATQLIPYASDIRFYPFIEPAKDLNDFISSQPMVVEDWT
jgi:hypothetical protein